MAAGRDIRGITVTIGGDTTKLQESPEAQKTILAIGGIVAAAGPLLVILGKTISAVGSAMKGFSSLGRGL